MTQLFSDHPGASASNICLFYGHDDNGGSHIPCGHHRYRMGHVEWNNTYPQLIARLQNDPVGWQRRILCGQANPRPAPRRFRVYPHLRRSYITDGMATHFMLAGMRRLNNLELDPIPLPPNILGIQSMGVYRAYIAIRCCLAIPEPVPMHPFDFHVLVGVPGELGIIGRNVLEHMHLLYRARFNHHALHGSRPLGRLYFGRDTESRTY